MHALFVVWKMAWIPVCNIWDDATIVENDNISDFICRVGIFEYLSVGLELTLWLFSLGYI